MPIPLYRRLENDLLASFPEEFSRKRDATWRPGHETWQKILVALRRLGTGRSYDDLDDSARMSGEFISKYTRIFCPSCAKLYGNEYLNRRPTAEELKKISEKYEFAGFPGCVGSVDCMKIEWENCPKVLKGQFYNPKDSKLAVLSVEGWCDRDLYIWHWFIGRRGQTMTSQLLTLHHFLMTY